jgi:DNA-binding XRE family transcriptional regulator
MIKSEKQKNRTLQSIENFTQELNKILSAQGLEPELAETYKNSYGVMINELTKEVQEYEELKAGKFTLPKNITFVELLKNLTKIRISRGLSQQDLADMIGVSRQQINRYEENNYQNVSIEKVNAILSAFNINLDMRTAA